MVRTKKPSAKKQTHNKCKNAKGLRPYKWSEPKKKLSQKSNLKESKDGCQKGGRRFSEPSASIIRQSYESTPRKGGGRRFSKNKICAHCLLWQQLVTRTNHDQQSTNAPKAQTPNLRNGDTNKPSARKGGDVFLKIPRT